jgi:hypothetical protein
MQKNSIAAAILAGLCCLASEVGAVNLNPNGLGQVLIYPYYTVQAGQGTLVSVVNTTNIGKAVKVRFLEAYNGRDVLTFNLFLSPYDVWTANLFALSDAGLPGSAAAVFTPDNSCTAPAFTQGPLSNGFGYQQFLNFGFTGAYADSGPTTDDRTREGHIEMISMADVLQDSALDADISHVNEVPADCASAEADFEAGVSTLPPTSGLYGSASIVDVNEGTFYAYNADAIDGFTYVTLATLPGDPQPNLASANDRGSSSTTTSHVFVDGDSIASTFPSTSAIDAVSSLFVADSLYNEYVATSDSVTGTDWVLTFPTKRFYVDPLFVAAAVPPFEHLFGAVETENGPGMSCTLTGLVMFDREEETEIPACGFPECPPGGPPQGFCLETNVLRFSAASVIGSMLPVEDVVAFNQGAVWLSFDAYAMNPAGNGNVFHGLPVTGFAAVKFVNSFVPAPGGGYALANYTAGYRHRIATSCTNNGGACS